MREEFCINSFEELDLYGYVWKPDNDAKIHGAIVLCHGMAETIERYDAFANFIASKGYFVYGYNQRGHGSHAKMLGYLGEEGWYKLKEDLKHVVEKASSELTDMPVILMGHSMGSFVTRSFLIDYSYLLDGVILSGTGYFSRASLALGKWLSSNDVKKHGDKHLSMQIDKIAFGSNNKKIKNPRTPFDWLSRDSEMVDRYIADPLCGQVHPSSFFYEFFNGLQHMLYQASYSNFKANLPMLLLSGADDPVGGFGKGVAKSEKMYRDLGFKTTLKLYEEGRHEMLNEINRQTVFEDIYAFIKSIS